MPRETSADSLSSDLNQLGSDWVLQEIVDNKLSSKSDVSEGAGAKSALNIVSAPKKSSASNHSSGNNDSVLVLDPPTVKFEELVLKAKESGRIGGEFKCPTCGSRYNLRTAATKCCPAL